MEDRDTWEQQLLAPLPGEAKKPIRPAAVEDEGAEFLNFMGTMTG